jgi:fatty-acyl-CoA synthase
MGRHRRRATLADAAGPRRRARVRCHPPVRLTEPFGPSAINDWRSEWNARPAEEQARLKARQGVRSVVAVPLRVLDAEGEDVPADGQSIGEVAIRGNTVMFGYYRDPEATTAAAPDGWFRTGDLGVMHPDGYVELRDRAKDVIISGGENISSVEVEAAISSHPAVLEVAVIAVPDERWGERPRAYVTLMDGAGAEAGEIRAHARERLPSFKVPDSVIFGPLPKTGTGKIQKFVLRRDAWGGHAKRIA